MSLNQMQFPGMPSRGPSARPRLEKYAEGMGQTKASDTLNMQKESVFTRPSRQRDDYTSAHTMAGEWQANPIYDRAAGDVSFNDALNRQKQGFEFGMPQEEFIPTYRVNSPQEDINVNAVNHMVENANPLALDDAPYATAYTDTDGKESYRLSDGNHRTNAALRRGQLLMPSEVERANVPYTPTPPRTRATPKANSADTRNLQTILDALH